MQIAGRYRLEHPAEWLHHLFWGALDWLYPPQCGGCQTLGTRWCSQCQSDCRRIISGCPRCGRPEPSPSPVCAECAAQPPAFDALRSWAIYTGPLRFAILRLKYHQDVGLGEIFAQSLIELYQQVNWPVDLIVPVPLSADHAWERGYNQSTLLARPLALRLRIPLRPRALRRTRITQAQVGLNAQERRENVNRAFLADPREVAGKSMLIVDDVTTTGATMQACAEALREAGARSVYGLTLARAAHPSPDGDQQP